MKLQEVLTEYQYNNVGQFRAIAESLGYKEAYNKGSLLFTRNDEVFRIDMDKIRSHTKREPDLSAEKASMDRVCQFFNRDQALSPDYKSVLKNEGVDIVNWGDLKNDAKDRFTVIDHKNKICYTGKELYEYALQNIHLGIDIKTQITLNELGGVETVVVAVPMLKDVDLTTFIVLALGEEPENIIVNGTGTYKYHSSVADCGVTGRKLACDFYGTACPIGGGSPWTKDGSKADVTLNIYVRRLALQYLEDNDECFVYLSSCIGRSELPSAAVKTVKNGMSNVQKWQIIKQPSEIITELGLNKPVFARLCRKGFI